MTTPPRPGRPDDADIDAAFAAIVAGWDDDAPDPSKPVQELPPAVSEPRRPQFDVAPPQWRVHVAPDDEEVEDDDFVQPDPPLPKGDLRFWLAVVGLALGPVLFVGWVLTGPHSTDLPLLLAGLATLGGFAAMISKLPDRRDDGDDGARV